MAAWAWPEEVTSIPSQGRGAKLLEEPRDGHRDPVGVPQGGQLSKPLLLQSLDLPKVGHLLVLPAGDQLLELVVQVLQGGAGIGHNPYLSGIVLAYLLGVYVDMHQLGRRYGEAHAAAVGAGGLVGEAAPHGQDDVRRAGEGIPARRALGAGMPPIERVVFGETPLPLEGGNNRRAQRLSHLAQLIESPGQVHTAPCQNDGPSCRRQEYRCTVYLIRIPPDAPPRLRPDLLRQLDLHIIRLHVHGEAYEDRPRPPAQHLVEGVGEHVG